MRRLVIVGQRATGSPSFLLADLPGTGGRLDVLLRALRAGLLVSHGLRTDTRVYLAMLAGPSPRVLRVDGASAKFVRPDERSLAVLVQKSLARAGDGEAGFREVRPGIALAEGGLSVALDDAGGRALYLLEAGGRDVRDPSVDLGDATFVLGDDRGLTEYARAELARRGAAALGVGPRDLHTEDAVAVLHNEIDRRQAG